MAGAGYKLFNTGDVLTAAQVNTYLQEQVVMRFANAAARTTALSGVLAEGMMSYLQDTDAVEVYNGSAWVSVGSTGDITGVAAGTGLSGGGTSGDVTLSLSTPVSATNGGTAQTTYTTGDLLYASASNTLAKRSIGTTGQVLTVSGGVPTWSTPAGGGKVLQVVYATTSTSASLTGQTWTDTNLTATITPSSTSSKVLVMWFQDYYSSGSNNGILYRLRRGSTTIQENNNAGTLVLYNVSSAQGNMAANSYLDSPATTSATTYKTQMNNYLSGGTCIAQPDSNKPSSIILMEIGA